jgi:hypothetical protein
LINLLRHGGEEGSMAPPEAVLQIAAARRRGNAKPLLALALQQPIWPGPSGPASEYSQGDNVAVSCDDLPARGAKRPARSLRLFEPDTPRAIHVERDHALPGRSRTHH